jgi:hypothetical protein
VNLQEKEISPCDFLIIGAGILGRYSYFRLKRLYPDSKVEILDASRFITELQLNTKIDSNIHYLGNTIRHSLFGTDGSKVWGGAMMPWPTEVLESTESMELVCNLFGLEFSQSIEKIGECIFQRIDAQVLKDVGLLSLFPENSVIHSLVTRLSKTSEGFYKVYFRSQDDSIFCLESKVVFLAAGTVENTRLLLQNIGLVDEASRPNLGQNLSDHLSINLGHFNVGLFNNKMRRYLKYNDINGNEYWPRLVSTHNEHCHYFVHFSPTGSGADTGTIKRILNRLFFRLGFRKVEASLFFEKCVGKSNLSIIDDQLIIDFHIEKSELENVEQLSLKLRKVLVESFGIKFFQHNKLSNNESTLMLISDTLHPAGTIRRAENPKDGVVDLNNQVNGSKGLYVLGAATFTRSSATHPTLTALAQAETIFQSLG